MSTNHHEPTRTSGAVQSTPSRRPLIFADEVFRIQGAVFEVNRVLGAGFLEAVYQECLAIEFGARRIPFAAKAAVPVVYKGRELRQRYEPDFMCFDSVVVELKASRETAPEYRAQVLNYLKATGMQVGLLVNFGCAPARIERLVL